MPPPLSLGLQRWHANLVLGTNCLIWMTYETHSGLGKPEATCLSRKTPDILKSLQNQGQSQKARGLVLTAGLSSDTPRRHRTSPLSLTAHSAILCPFPPASALSGMMDTSLRVMGATSSHGPLVTSLHFLCREIGAWVQGPGVTGSLGTAHHYLLLTRPTCS